jgi:hypothetical protein
MSPLSGEVLTVRPNISSLVATTLLLAVAATASTQGQDRPHSGTISGKVFFRGRPLPGGTISFAPAKGKAVVVSLRGDGTYAAARLPVGELRVAIETESVAPKPPRAKDAKTTPPPPPPPGGPRYVPIPRKYGDLNTSGLTLEVKAGEQIADFQLK